MWWTLTCALGYLGLVLFFLAPRNSRMCSIGFATLVACCPALVAGAAG
jgi:hypothetical protein